ncbi:Long-chain-fatty-acid-coa ligase, partial [Globisporangium splendens]
MGCFDVNSAASTRVSSKELPGTATETRGAIRVYNAADPKHNGGTFDAELTLYATLMNRKKLDPSGTGKLFGTRKLDPVTGQRGDYEWVTFGEFLSDVEALSSALSHELKVVRNDIVGVFSKNRYEWSLVEHSCNRMTYTLVPLYDTLGPTAVPFIMNHTEMKVVFCAKDQFKTLMSCIHECPHIRTIVQYEEIDDEERNLASEYNVELKTLAELKMIGKANPVPADPPTGQDLSTICYTSGTTGNPKGAMLTHNNIASTVASFHVTKIYPSDVHISYLPLAHVFERVIHTVLIANGCQIGFYQGEVTKLMEDIGVLKPTLFLSVPRVLNRVFDKITQGVKEVGGAKQYLFEKALASKLQRLRTQGIYTHSFWDALVFNKLKALLGGRVRMVLSGSAPMTKEVKEFLSVVFGCPVVEGYGLTESTAGMSCATDDIIPGNNVGPPLYHIQIRLEDVPDMNYTSKDKPLPRGEILVRGPNVFVGYYKQPELTAQVLSEDGWLHTGDIGCWNPDGTLRIIDRKKNIFKLSQGEYVAPEKVEGVYLKSAFVGEVFVHGDSLQSYVVGFVVPDPDVVAKWAAQQGLTGEDASMAKLCANEELKKVIVADMAEYAKANKLFRFEQIQKLHLHPKPFAESDLITPTFKLKRPQLVKFFEKEIHEMYHEPPAF